MMMRKLLATTLLVCVIGFAASCGSKLIVLPESQEIKTHKELPCVPEDMVCLSKGHLDNIADEYQRCLERLEALHRTAK